LFPWTGPNGTLWQINHNPGSMANACHGLAMANRVWNLGLALVILVVFTLLAFRYRSKVFQNLRLHPRFD